MNNRGCCQSSPRPPSPTSVTGNVTGVTLRDRDLDCPKSSHRSSRGTLSSLIRVVRGSQPIIVADRKYGQHRTTRMEQCLSVQVRRCVLSVSVTTLVATCREASSLLCSAVEQAAPSVAGGCDHLPSVHLLAPHRREPSPKPGPRSPSDRDRSVPSIALRNPRRRQMHHTELSVDEIGASLRYAAGASSSTPPHRILAPVI